MSHHNIFLLYFVSAVVFLGLDSVWLGLVSPKLYKHFIGGLMAKKPNWLAAALFYIIFIIGLLVFVIQPSLGGSIWHLVKLSSLFGLVTYATFDLTNQAVLKDWPTAISAIDIAWGIVITTLSSLVIYWIF